MTVRSFISGPCQWAPETALALRRLRVEELIQERGLCWNGYSTEKYLGVDVDRDLVWLELVDDDHGLKVDVGGLSRDIARGFSDLGLEFLSQSEVPQTQARATMMLAWDVIQRVPPLAGTVAAMCRQVHPLRADDPTTDISFSDPTIPFSAFVSIPSPEDPCAPLRLAESWIHEALHLQLSVVERYLPLILSMPRRASVYSPWKGEGRSVQGLLHAVYVFGNIRHFWERVAPRLEAEQATFALQRVVQIEQEFAGAGHLLDSEELTADGLTLGMAMFARPTT